MTTLKANQLTGGTAVVSFGAVPGSGDARVVVAAPAVLSTSVVQAWIAGTPSADHTADEHCIEPIQVVVRDLVPGVGFTIWIQGLTTSALVGAWNLQWSLFN